MGHFGSLWLVMSHFGPFRVLVQPKVKLLYLLY